MDVLAHTRQSLPWWLKVGSKLVLSRLPADYRLWQGLSLFRHGKMDQPEYAYRVFRRHFDRSDFARKDVGFVSLEMGPGDSLFSCLIANALGGSYTWLVDAGDFARNDAAAYREMVQFLETQGFSISIPDGDREAFLRSQHATYTTDGLDSLARMPSDSVDWIWSHAVLEHIRRHQFLPVMTELRRVLRKDGICSHKVDLRDHLGGALNNLRFPETIWEADWMAKSGFYTNRIQFAEMCDLFERAGFAVEVLATERWEELPTPLQSFSEPFRSMSEDALTVKSFDVLLRPR